MAFINPQSKEVHCKVVYYGAPLCGKSTSLRYIYEHTKGKKKGELISLSTEEDRTLYFDFVPLDLGKHNRYQIRLHLYTVPGEVGYKAARKIIAKGVDGIVFLADSQLERLEDNLKAMMELKEIVEGEGGDFAAMPMVIQYNKRDLKDAVAVEELRRLLNPSKLPDFETIATRGQGVFDALKSISVGVLKSLKEES